MNKLSYSLITDVFLFFFPSKTPESHLATICDDQKIINTIKKTSDMDLLIVLKSLDVLKVGGSWLNKEHCNPSGAVFNQKDLENLV